MSLIKNRICKNTGLNYNLRGGTDVLPLLVSAGGEAGAQENSSGIFERLHLSVAASPQP